MDDMLRLDGPTVLVKELSVNDIRVKDGESIYLDYLQDWLEEAQDKFSTTGKEVYLVIKVS